MYVCIHVYVGYVCLYRFICMCVYACICIVYIVIRTHSNRLTCQFQSGRSENGKGNYWAIHPANVEDFSKRDFRRRRARRQVIKTIGPLGGGRGEAI